MSARRLAVVLARAGIGSRRACDALVTAGRVQIDGAVVRDPAVRVDPAAAAIEVDGRPLPAAQPLRYYALNKPHGVVSTARDDRGRRSAVDFLPDDAGRCVPIGRLDRDSEGLLLLSNDGPLIDGLLHPRREVARTYLAELQGRPDDAALDAIFAGVHAADGLLRAKPRRSKRPGREMPAGRTSWLRLTLHTGRKRELRRLCEAVGYPVVRLRRVAFGPVLLRDLPVGRLRPLSAREVRLLRRAAGLAEDGAAQTAGTASRAGRASRADSADYDRSDD